MWVKFLGIKKLTNIDIPSEIFHSLFLDPQSSILDDPKNEKKLIYEIISWIIDNNLKSREYYANQNNNSSDTIPNYNIKFIERTRLILSTLLHKAYNNIYETPVFYNKIRKDIKQGKLFSESIQIFC